VNSPGDSAATIAAMASSAIVLNPIGASTPPAPSEFAEGMPPATFVTSLSTAATTDGPASTPEFVLITASATARSRPMTDLFRPAGDVSHLANIDRPRFERLATIPTANLVATWSERLKTVGIELPTPAAIRFTTAADDGAGGIWKRLRRVSPGESIGTQLVDAQAEEPR
jgi:hypothetical protein